MYFIKFLIVLKATLTLLELLFRIQKNTSDKLKLINQNKFLHYTTIILK